VAEEEQEFDAAEEARKIVSGYINRLGWSTENKRMIINQLIPFAQMEPKLQDAEEVELSADEYFGGEVDRWRKDGSKRARQVLNEVLRLIEHRSDLSLMGKRMRARLKEEGYGLEHI